MDESRISIQSIQVKNFRSIRNVIILAKNLNIFVGLNDVGKSNLLKALNLFFNGETDYNTQFDFKKDFSYLFPEKSHSTREIKISIKFNIPSTYKEPGIYTWEKTWRTENFYEERIRNDSGQEPSARSRIPSTLRRIRYRYVPAVKSPNYFKTLLENLYLTVSASIGSPLEATTSNFSNALKTYTHTITDNVKARIGISSELTVPDDLRDIFKALVFSTKVNEERISVPLDARGDGIQARHIPIVLKYIADEDQKSRNRGSMKISTIWGFEEPENGVEIGKAFEMANEFKEYSREIQLFVTTHSPAFYMKDSSDDTEIFYTIRKPQHEGTTYVNGMDARLISEHMGLMPLLAPFVAEKLEELKRIQTISTNAFLSDIDTILVEGITDKGYLEIAIKKFSPELQELIDNQKLRIFARKEQGGTHQLSDWVISWAYSGYRHKLFVLFDKDAEGIAAKKDLEQSELFQKKNGEVRISTQFIQPSNEIANFFHNNIEFKYEIEHLLSPDIWKKMKAQNYVEAREYAELLSMFGSKMQRDKTIDNIIDDCISDTDLRDTIVTFNPHTDKKQQILNLVKREIESAPDSTAIDGFQRTVEKIKSYIVR